ncbi:hypothetical protein ABK040_014790 [Willaertia magna]
MPPKPTLQISTHFDENSSSADEATDENPFRIPKDEEIFELKEKKYSKKQSNTTTKSALYTSPRRTNYNKEKSLLPSIYNKSKSAPSTADSVMSSVKAKEKEVKKKENMADFIEKKRQMFLIQMSIDTKNFEIKKLDKKATKREQKLLQLEQELKQQTQAFDDFLALNDIRAVEAIKKAEDETKAKQAKQNEIKKLNARIAAINTDIAKLDEQLENCRRYKEFLDKLTPPEEIKRIQEMKRKKKEERLKSNKSSSSSTNNSFRERNEEEKIETKLTVIAPIENQESDDEFDEDEMYFTKPEQLLNIYSELEENNLFLIQNTEEIQEQLEEIQKVYRETKKKMTAEAENLQSQIDSLNEQIEIEQQKLKAISERQMTNNDQECEEKLKILAEKIKEIYIQSGFASETGLADDSFNAGLMDGNSLGDPLLMLTRIETKLESLLSVLDEYDDEFIIKYEKLREKERRKQQREEKNKKPPVERRKNDTNTVQIAASKRMGRRMRPLVFRSAPIQNTENKKSKRDSEGSNEKNERDEFKELFQLP